MSFPYTNVLGVTKVFASDCSILGLLSQQTCKHTVSLIQAYAQTDLPTKELNLD